MSAGCTSLALPTDEVTKRGDPGTLVVANEHSSAHLVEVSVTGRKLVDQENISREVQRIVESGFEWQIPIGANETEVYPDFISEPVMYTVEMRLGPDQVRTIDFTPIAMDSDSKGSFLTIEIKRNGKVWWTLSSTD